MWGAIGIASLAMGSACALTYIIARMVGHGISPAHNGKWAIADGDLPKDLERFPRYPMSGPDPQLISYWLRKGIPTRTGVRNLSNNRVFMAMLHSRTDLSLVNEFIMTLKRSGRTGSTHKLHPRADYDFDLVSWATILHLFGDDSNVLHPSTVDHIVYEMMIDDRKHPGIHVPWTLGTIIETENHVLMTEGSYYLCSKWLEDRHRLKGSDHPSSKERGSFLIDYLGSILHKGFYEFNSDPYSSYTTHALLNLEAFGSEEISRRARSIIDRTVLLYRIGSLGHRRFPPFRRRTERSTVTSLTSDGFRPYMMAWEGIPISQDDGPAHALVGSLLRYRPTKSSGSLFDDDRMVTTAFIGHGPISSPEIYSKGPGFLISAGGVNRGYFSRLVNRPTTLILEDSAKDLSEIVHIGGPGPRQFEHNNTGVVRNVAVGRDPVIVPDDWRALRTVGQWSIYHRAGLYISVQSRDRFGIFYVSSDGTSADRIATLNSDPERLAESFEWMEGRSMTYDVGSPSDRWAINTLDGKSTDRRMDLWPKLRTIEMKGIC
jgi:hypothetical protein